MVKMAGGVDLVTQINNMQKSYNDAVQRNQEIQAKITALEDAREYVRSAKEHARDVVTDIDKIELAENWKGGRRNRLKESKEGYMFNEAKTYRDAIESLEKSINSKIQELCGQKNYAVQLMYSMQRGIEKLNKQLNGTQR